MTGLLFEEYGCFIRMHGRSNIMQESIGRATAPTTEADEPDAREPDADARRRVRDTRPTVDYEDTALSDPSRRRSVDPLDPHRPSRETGDPLDPDGHVI
jgi:hypothetical protein